MRKEIVSVLMIPLLLLVGCGEREAGPEDVFASFRDEILAAERLETEVRLTADFGGTVSEYTLSASSDGEETTVTVTEPALIAGVTAKARADDASLSYDGVMLGVGALDGEGTTPVSAAPVILRTMIGGYAELYWNDGSYAAARFYVGETTACTVWLDPGTRSPVAAEISSDGHTVITCRFTDWKII